MLVTQFKVQSLDSIFKFPRLVPTSKQLMLNQLDSNLVGGGLALTVLLTGLTFRSHSMS